LKKIGNAQFDESAQLLRDPLGKIIALRGQSIKVLDTLVGANGALVTKEQLMDAVWGKTIVSDDSLVQCIKEIRQASGDAAHEILQTVHRRGYRLVLAEQVEAAQLPLVQLAKQTMPSKPSLAILGFTSFDGDERSERLALSFAGDLSSELARQSELRLISRHSAFALRGQPLSTQEICTKLGVSYFVAGQVQFSEEGIRWSIELVNGMHDQVVWSEHKHVQYTDMGVATDDLTWRIACSVYNSLRRSTRTLALAQAPESLDAYETTAVVLLTLFKASIAATKESQKLGAIAVIKYPQYAQAWMALAHTHSWDLLNGNTGEWHDGRVPQLLEEIHKAIDLDPTHAYSFAILSSALMSNGQFEEAIVAVERAVSLAPSDPDMLQFKSATLFWYGKLEQSLTTTQAMMKVLSTRPTPHLASHGRTLYFSGQQTEGIKYLMEAVAIAPGSNQARMTLIVALHESGEYAQAAEHFEHLRRNTIGFTTAFFGVRWAKIPEIRDRYLKALRAYGLEKISS
jgi:TolB-like protein/Flp pilus assembly protein TadD